MARARMITRTVRSTQVKFLSVNLDTRLTDETDCNLAGVYKSDEEVLKTLKKLYDGENIKPVQVLSTQEVEQLYGMKETEFLKYAEIIPAKGE